MKIKTHKDNTYILFWAIRTGHIYFTFTGPGSKKKRGKKIVLSLTRTEAIGFAHAILAEAERLPIDATPINSQEI